MPITPGFAETVRTGGAGAALGTTRMLGDAYKKIEPQFSLEIVPNLGSFGGMQALEHSAVHFALIGRPLKTDEIARGYAGLEYGRTPFVLATSRSNVAGLTPREIADIYAGRASYFKSLYTARRRHRRYITKPVRQTELQLQIVRIFGLTPKAAPKRPQQTTTAGPARVLLAGRQRAQQAGRDDDAQESGSRRGGCRKRKP